MTEPLMTEAEARELFREYLAEDVETSPTTPEALSPEELALEWEIWLLMTQVETNLVDPEEARTWTPT